MLKKEKVDDFQIRTAKLGMELQNLIDDMTAYSAQCHEARIMFKRYNRLIKSKMDTICMLDAAISEMNRTVSCIQGEI